MNSVPYKVCYNHYDYHPLLSPPVYPDFEKPILEPINVTQNSDKISIFLEFSNEGFVLVDNILVSNGSSWDTAYFNYVTGNLIKINSLELSSKSLNISVLDIFGNKEEFSIDINSIRMIMDKSPPEILGVCWYPDYPYENEVVQVYISVHDESNVSVILSYFYNGEWKNISALYNRTLDIFIASLKDLLGRIYFKVYAIDESKNFAVSQVYVINFRKKSVLADYLPYIIIISIVSSSVAVIIMLYRKGYFKLRKIKNLNKDS